MELELTDFANMLDFPLDQVESALGGPGNWPSLTYNVLSQEAEQECYSVAREALYGTKLRVCDRSSQDVWEKGWGEVLENIRRNGFKQEHLTPQYFRHNILRLGGKYVSVDDLQFEEKLYTEIKRVVFNAYFGDVSSVVEFGCGTGKSLMLLTEMYPQIEVIGCDWSKPAVEIANTIAKETGRNIRGSLFNLFTLEGHEQFEIGHESGVYTFHTLEQIGDEFEPFINFILSRKPTICVHLEPIKEFYDVNSEFDRVAIQYHERRNYLDGFYFYLKKLEDERKIIMHKSQRLGFGSMFHEAYSLVVWSPLE